MMKQVRIRQPGGLAHLEYGEGEHLEPGPGEILVAIEASSLNYHDLMVARGELPVEDGRVPLSDFAGEVRAVGPNVTTWQPKDEVMSVCFPLWQDGPPTREQLVFVGEHTDGFAREYALVAGNAVTRIPGGYSLREAATLPCAGVTAWRALREVGGVQSGDTVLVQGSGGVSIFALQIARAMGAEVIALSSSDEKLEKMAELGATEGINYRTVPEWGKEVLARTSGQGVDHVIEVGGAKTFKQSVIAARMGGHIAMIGILSGARGELNLPSIFYKQLRITGITMGSRATQENMVEDLSGRAFRPVISDEFPLKKLADAFEHQAAGRHFGKIVIRV